MDGSPNYPVDGYLVDFAFPDIKLAVEIDGFGWHRDIQAFQHDRRRRNALVTSGWTVLNFTWADLLERPTRRSMPSSPHVDDCQPPEHAICPGFRDQPHSQAGTYSDNAALTASRPIAAAAS